jgi:hypothetical protein
MVPNVLSDGIVRPLANTMPARTPLRILTLVRYSSRLTDAPYRYTSTGIFECVSTLTVSLPRTTAETPRRPCEAITIKSHFLASAASMIA